MAYIYSQEGRWEKAIAEYKKLIKLDPEDFNAQNMMGDVYVKKGEAQPAFESYWIASEAYSRLGQMEKAGVVYRKIAKLDPKLLTPESQKKQVVFQKLAEGDAALEAGEFDRAIEAYQAVLQLDPERFDIFQKLGDLHLRKGELEKAVRQYKDIADIYFKNKLHKKAAPIYKKIIELDPSDVDAHAAMGEIHAKSGNESDAKKEYLLIAEAMLNKGDLDTAMNFAKKAVALKSIEAYFYLGQVLFKQGKFDEAKAEYEKLLRVKSNHAGALISMGQIQLKAGSADEALKNFEKALKVDKNNLEAYELAAAQLAVKGQNQQAAVYLAEASAIAAMGNQTERAAELAQRAKGLDPAVKMTDSQGAENNANIEGSGQTAAPLSPPAPVTTFTPSSSTAPTPEPEPLHEELPSSAPALPPLPVIASFAMPPAPAPQLEAPAQDPQEERSTLLTMAQNLMAEGSLDEALSVYQRILTDFPEDAEAKAGQRRVFSLLAQDAMGGAVPAIAHTAQEDEARRKAEVDSAKLRAEEDARLKADAADASARLEQLRQQAEDEQRKLVEMRRAQDEAHRKAEAEEIALREAADARRKAEDETARKKQEEDSKRLSEDELRKQVETQIRKQLEEEYRRKAEEDARKRADEEVERRVEEARKKAEEEARTKVEEETRRIFAEESKKLDAEKDDTRKMLQAEMRLAIEAQEKAKFDQESLTKVDAERKKAEFETKQKIQQEVLARVQSQQKEKQAVYQKTIEEIRRKVEEAKQLPGESAKPAPAQASSAVDEMDDFMTATVADIYTKQGLVKEAVKIYEKILAREPGNAEIRKKLDALTGKVPAPEMARTEEKSDESTKKKSKVSYL